MRFSICAVVAAVVVHIVAANRPQTDHTVLANSITLDAKTKKHADANLPDTISPASSSSLHLANIEAIKAMGKAFAEQMQSHMQQQIEETVEQRVKAIEVEKAAQVSRDIQKAIDAKVAERVRMMQVEHDRNLQALEAAHLKDLQTKVENGIKEGVRQKEVELSSMMQAKVNEQVSKVVTDKMQYYPGIRSIKDLLEWNVSVAGPRIGPAPEPPVLPTGRRVLSMHDFAGGYQKLADNDYLMLFRSWDLVDIFVYFSHVRITVPPPVWTAMAHEHKRMVLGTIIFEGNSEDIQLMNAQKDKVVQKLVDVADHYGFDGWFVNNEAGGWSNGEPETLVAQLKAKMHDHFGPRSQVLAYPYSPRNKDMFDASDGVFMQYNWPLNDNYMKTLSEVAGDRKNDVYCGLDAFGGRRGNGEPDPQHVRMAAKHDMSIAVFAPGFTLEVAAKRNYSERAVLFDRHYWASIGRSFGRAIYAGNEPPTVTSIGSQWPVPFDGIATTNLASELFDSDVHKALP